MFSEYLLVFLVVVVFIKTGNTDRHGTEASDFQYTLCDWENSRCQQHDAETIISSKSDYNDRSLWPSGPYALLTPIEGCPESADKGWRNGHISLTWKQPHTLISANGCKIDKNNNQSYNKKENASFTSSCWHKLIPDFWPEIQSNMLGPFSKYALRLNFCFKIENKTEFHYDDFWPNVAFSIFGDGKSCPSGFRSSERTLKFPAISSWTSYGFLPNLTINTTGEDNSVRLTLKTCDRQPDNTASNEMRYQYLISNDAFILMKNDLSDSCPYVEGTKLIDEAFLLQNDTSNEEKFLNLFEICHYRPHSWFTDVSDSHLYDHRNLKTNFGHKDFKILNPTLIYGNKTSAIEIMPFHGLNTPDLVSVQKSTATPWLLIDLGRSLIVVGLHFTDFHLMIVDSQVYKGTLSQTIDGLPCQRWDLQWPHQHGMTKDKQFSDKSVSNAENYCRDPSGDGMIWCYTKDPSIRWNKCTNTVYRFRYEDRPFSKCYMSDKRWQIDEFGAISCTYAVSYYEYDETEVLYYTFRKELEGRYVKLVGYPGTSSSRFNRLVQHVDVLTSIKRLSDYSMCNLDLGMGDESIRDFQITASSWLPQTPPTSGRPYFSGWCSEMADKNPYISVDLLKNTKLEGITIFNWEQIEEDVTSGVYRKRFIPVGSKDVFVSFCAQNNRNRPLACFNETFSLDTFLPVHKPQTFFQSPVLARYVTVYILESMTEFASCLRFELHGCKQNGNSRGNLPELLSVDSMFGSVVTINNLQTVNDTSVITSLGYPEHYTGGMSYTWIIDLQDESYIQLMFLNLSFNEYESDAWEQCRDTLRFLPDAYFVETLNIDQRFNDRVFLIKTDRSYMVMAFTICRPTSKIQSIGSGFKAVVSTLDKPTCFSPAGISLQNLDNYCYRTKPVMFLSSTSLFNFPYQNEPEVWHIYMKRASLLVEFIHFNARCDTGSSLYVSDRFYGKWSYCNLRMRPRSIHSESEAIIIRFEKGKDEAVAESRRKSAKEGFSAVYKAFQKSLLHLIDSQKTYSQVLRKIAELEEYWDPQWKNATLLAYKVCSKKLGKCYFIYSGARTTWKTAGKECWIRQTNLISIHSDEEEEFIKYILRNFRFTGLEHERVRTAFRSETVDPNYFTHIGLSRVISETGKHVHSWENGSPVTFSAWKPNEPSSDKDCTRMSFHLFYSNSTWEAENCEKGLASYFVCEHPVTPKLLNSSSTQYTGTRNYTLSGTPCQRWDSQYPHGHGYIYDKIYPDGSVSAAENYCRDLDGSGNPWCYTLDPDNRWEICLSKEDDFSPRSYIGRLSTTSSGRTCQRWDTQFPNRHRYTKDTQFPDATTEDAANFCRDPSDEGTLWCYTTDPYRRWEPCNSIDSASDRCYNTLKMYMGHWNITHSGKTCQSWIAQEPHEHEVFVDTQFPDRSVADASNYCRDPYNEGYLWCYTTDPNTKSEPCVFDYKYQIEDNINTVSLTNETFECGNGDHIPLKHFCDGIPNCDDVTDETVCTNTVHPLMENRKVPAETSAMNGTYSLYRCQSNEWISMLSLCDGVIDCGDATDEINCSQSRGPTGCFQNEYPCNDGGCVHISQMCDYIADCNDASDENCDYPLCSSTEYRCRNQQCIPVENRCDAYKDCLDGSDEIDCDFCRSKAFHCDLRSCIPKRLVCDKYTDCIDESDEMSCDQPTRQSCEEWWTAGYRKTGIFKLNDTEAECNFDDVRTKGIIVTILNSFEVSKSLRHDAEVIYSTVNELNGFANSTTTKFFYNEDYDCSQKITQSCVPAYKAVATYEDQRHENVNYHCSCLEMIVNPSHNNQSASVYYCGSTEVVTDDDEVLFQYSDDKGMRSISLKDNFPDGVEITFGPVICQHKEIFVEKDVGCGDETVFPLSVRCVYDTDPAGYIIGCRSGLHLKECDTFQCPEYTVKCPGSFCLPLKFVCDGKIQCPDGQDELNCGCSLEKKEIVLLYKDGKGYEDTKEMHSIATQFFNADSTLRELRYRTKTLPDKLDFEHLVLDISDKEIAPYANTDRQYVCNYSILASNFVNDIAFSENFTKGIIFFQERNETDKLPRMLFGKLKTRPDFAIYRVMIEDTAMNNQESFSFVQDVTVKRLSTLVKLGARYFPDLCKEAAKVQCPNEYKCASSKTCIPLDQICDGYAQCEYGDDERMCGYSCPENCSCFEYATNCSFANIDNATLNSLNKKSRLLDLSGNFRLNRTLVSSKWQYPHLIILNLSNCDIKEISKHIFQALVNLWSLDLSYNKFLTIPESAFVGLRKLRSLNLFGNKEIFSLESFSLSGLLSLRTLELRGATISKMSAYSFSGLKLDKLFFSNNKIIEMEDDVFSELNVKTIDMEANELITFDKGLFRGVSGMTSLRTPAFKYCCVRPNYLAEENCYPRKDEFSSCDDLLRLSALQTMLWLIGILALFGNILAVIYRLIYDRERLKFGYGIFVTNLAIADFLMGIYLIIIAIADAAFRKRYIFMDDLWRNGAWCTLAGFLSTVSSEASVFFLCLITLDRLLVIKYPFGQIRFDTKKSGIACAVSWSVSLSVGLIPIIHSDYFQDQFYSKSGVCIALPLTKDQPPGWLYSIIILVGLNFATFCLIALGQVIIYLEIKKATSGIRHSSGRRGTAGSGRRRELTVARNLFLVVATDFLCWFPIGCMGMMSLSGHVIPGDVYAWTAVFVLPINSALNPVLYTLTAIIGRRKPEPSADESECSIRMTLRSKRIKPLNGLFRYFITQKGGHEQAFVSLDDILRDNIKIKAIDIAKIALHLIQSITLLHKHSLVMNKLDGGTVYTVVDSEKIVGDIQLRQEPTVCYNPTEKADDMYKFGQVIRSLLAKRNKQILK